VYLDAVIVLAIRHSQFEGNILAFDEILSFHALAKEN
jgi:hypothetical protein